jgi:AcrR family transcriptional regulator
VSGVNDQAPETEQRIADGALRVLARRGLHKLSMTDISDEAGVSRGTLYRYFASRDEVVAAVEERVEESLRSALQAAVVATPSEDERVRIVLEALAGHARAVPALGLLVETEPGLVLEYLGRRLGALRELLQEFLRPALTRAPAVRAGTMTEEQLAELWLRLLVSEGVLRSPDLGGSGSRSVEKLAMLLEPDAAPPVPLRRAS